MDRNLLEFPVSVYGKIEQFSDVLSKARCRIFYKGANRNGTFITDEFAKELISTLHYVPVKGIYDTDDYTDHGEKRSEGRIYGIVPENNNFAWESHLDEDGVERTYACTDVLLFTALYPEASEIVGKGQSMELYEPSITYHFAIFNGQKYLVFEHGSFLGLQVLGDTVEPCFEGASFFSLQQSIQDTIDRIKLYSSTTGGSPEMDHITFKISDDQKYSMIWELLNPNFTAEGNWTVDYCILDVYDDYALCFKPEDGSYERVYYSKNDETDSLEITNHIKVFVMDITEEEKNTVETLRKLNGDTYELVSENLLHADENAENCATLNSKVEEFTTLNATLTSEKENLQNQVEELNTQYSNATAQISTLTEENAALTTYKTTIETQQKEAVITEYNDKLSTEILESYRAKMDQYTCEELDMHLAYELKKASPSVFSKNGEDGEVYLPKAAPLSGVEQILSRYAKK